MSGSSERSLEVCRICGHSDLTAMSVPEMMFGMEEIFLYLECTKCGCLQIDTIPDNMADYYPSNYYSFAPRIPKSSWLKRVESTLLRTPLHVLWPDIKIQRVHRWLRHGKVNLNSRILDVGCGSGALLCQLATAGFRQLQGADPFLDTPKSYPNGVVIRAESVLSLRDEQFDFIMMNHSFEHMPNPHEILKHCLSLLSDTGILMIRIPTVDSEAFDTYREHWFQLDAPRHFFLHSLKSISHLAHDTGFVLSSHFDEARESQFWASEQYRAGIPHRSSNSYEETGTSALFSESDVQRWRRKSRALNRIGRGDAMALFFHKAPLT